MRESNTKFSNSETLTLAQMSDNKRPAVDRYSQSSELSCLVYEHLLVSSKCWHRPADIAKAVVNKGATAKMVNPALYELLKLKLLVKHSEDNGTAPEWRLA